MTLDQLLGDGALDGFMEAMGSEWTLTSQDPVGNDHVRITINKMVAVDQPDTPDSPVITESRGNITALISATTLDWEGMYVADPGTATIARMCGPLPAWARAAGIEQFRIPHFESDVLYVAIGYQHEGDVLVHELNPPPSRNEQYAAWKFSGGAKPSWA